VTWGEAGGWSETCQTGGMVFLSVFVLLNTEVTALRSGMIKYL
jgi:hypothetical protein